MKFQFDSQKNITNKVKHGIDFFKAIEVFNDPNRLEMDSTKEEYKESRTKTIGMIDDILVIVVIYTNREQYCRIISARTASHKERAEYELQKTM